MVIQKSSPETLLSEGPVWSETVLLKEGTQDSLKDLPMKFPWSCLHIDDVYHMCESPSVGKIFMWDVSSLSYSSIEELGKWKPGLKSKVTERKCPNQNSHKLLFHILYYSSSPSVPACMIVCMGTLVWQSQRPTLDDISHKQYTNFSFKTAFSWGQVLTGHIT